MIIRQATEKDYIKIIPMVKAAFETAEHSDGLEQDLVDLLRRSDAFVPELSLVAEIDGKILGHIMFTEAKVGLRNVLVLAPLSVSPEYQKQGIGTALIKAAHSIAQNMGYEYSLVLGSEKYYPRFGYLAAETFEIEVPKDIPSINFMAIKLLEDAKPIKGAVKYAKEFGI